MKHTALSVERKLCLAFVHHANQYLIADDYDDRPGVTDVAGGLAAVLRLHSAYRIPANLQISGTLIEALAWHNPRLLRQIADMYEQGLLELVGSSYGQNVMPFFDCDYNVRQLNEHLDVYKRHLGAHPEFVTSFWPPERVWHPSLRAVLRHPGLQNGGYRQVFVDDRVLLSQREAYDKVPNWQARLFHGYKIADSSLVAIPIAINLRHSIPPRGPEHDFRVREQLRWLHSLDPAVHAGDFLAVYGDDMEKAAGVGWDEAGPEQFGRLLSWVSQASWISPVKVSEWAESARMAGPIELEAGTYRELAVDFAAGESYEKWYLDRRWQPYREHFAWSVKRVAEVKELGADDALMALAEKHLLASSWESAWHTPCAGAHGQTDSDGGPAGFARAIASHSRHAAVIAEAAHWQKHKDGRCHAILSDIDNDGADELVLKNDKLFAVISPLCGGRIAALFSVADGGGAMSIGNPCDDWNLKEELNDYMDQPRNHPGALADVGFEHDRYGAEILIPDGSTVCARLHNEQGGSAAFGLAKTIFLSSYRDDNLQVQYDLPSSMAGIQVEFGFSPDYLNLLRGGRRSMTPYRLDGQRGWKSANLAVWVTPDDSASARWMEPYQRRFGHGRAMRLGVNKRQFSLRIGTRSVREEAVTTVQSALEAEVLK